MKIVVNGENRDIEDGATVQTLVQSLNLQKAAVAVEVNKQVVPRKLHEATTLAEGDTVELVTLVGGG